MPVQVVHLPRPLINAIDKHDRAVLNADLRDKDLQLATYVYGKRVIHALVAYFHCLTTTGIEERQTVIQLLTDNPVPGLMPVPIPAPITRRYHQDLSDALGRWSDLTGHERLDLFEAFEVAAATPTCPPIWDHCREIMIPSQWRQIQRGKIYQAALAEPLAAFDAELHDYDPSIGTMPTLDLVSALGWQSGLVAYLDETGIDIGDWQAISALLAKGDKDLAAIRELCEGLVEGAEEAGPAGELMNVRRERILSPAALLEVHGHVFGGILLEEKVGAPRNHDRGFDLETGEPGYPHHVITDQLWRHGRTFGRNLWEECHPVIRAGMAHLAFLKIRVFDRGNGEVGRIQLAYHLQERGIPELPLDLVLVRRHAEYSAAVRAALKDGDIVGFLRFLIEVCHQALRQGQEMADRLQMEIGRLKAAMAKLDTGSVDVDQLAIFICSRLIVEDYHVVFACPADPDAAIDVVRALASTGHLDEAVIDDEVHWSSPAVRILMHDLAIGNQS